MPARLFGLQGKDHVWTRGGGFSRKNEIVSDLAMDESTRELHKVHKEVRRITNRWSGFGLPRRLVICVPRSIPRQFRVKMGRIPGSLHQKQTKKKHTQVNGIVVETLGNYIFRILFFIFIYIYIVATSKAAKVKLRKWHRWERKFSNMRSNRPKYIYINK